MKRALSVCLLIAVLCLIGCAGSSEPKVYSHSQARFSITCPAGWSLTSQDNEMYEFRRGDVKLIEVGGFIFSTDPEEIEYMNSLSESELKEFLRSASLDGLEGYCEEAEIMNWTISDQFHMSWDGRPGYRIRANGYSDPAGVDMTLDLIAAIDMQSGMLYMLASQISKSQYEATKVDLEAAIQSFRVN